MPGEAPTCLFSMVMHLTLAVIPELASSQLRMALLTLGLLLSGLFVTLLLLAIRRSTITHSVHDQPRSTRKKSSPPIDAWVEAGRRLQVEPGVSRLDDTVDLDPLD